MAYSYDVVSETHAIKCDHDRCGRRSNRCASYMDLLHWLDANRWNVDPQALTVDPQKIPGNAGPLSGLRALCPEHAKQ